MRTRFLGTHCFAISTSSPGETLSFLNFPVPHPPPSHFPFSQQDLLSSFSVPDFKSPLKIHKFSVENALSTFLADVIPQSIDVEIGGLADDRRQNEVGCDGVSEFGKFGSARTVEAPFSEQETDAPCEEKEVKSQIAYESTIQETDFPEKDKETVADGKDKKWFELFQFETPELDAFLENGCFLEKEGMQILSNVPGIEEDQDTLKPELTLQYHNEVEDSVYLVENISLDYHMDHNPYSLEDEGSVQESSFYYKFPLLEVDETSLGISTQLCMEDEFLLLLENIGSQPWTENNNLTINSKELLGSVENNMLKFLSDHCLTKQCLEFELASPDIYLETDFVRIEETSHTKGHSSFSQGPPDGSCFLSASPIIFEEYVIVDIDLSQPSEVFFKTQTAHVPETCDQMFGEGTSFKSFNELVVAHELALVDETFISLPVPVLSDHEKVRSLYVIAEEILADLQPLLLSSSDGIYLDWQLLEEDKCKFRDYSSRRDIMEVDYESIDFDLRASDDGLFFDLLLSNDTLNAQNIEECKESLNMLRGGSSLVHRHPNEVPSKLLADGCAKPENGEQLSEEVSDRASLLFKSMSEFNDLDFFLNRQKATDSVNSECAVKSFFTHATTSKVLTSDSKAACADEVEACCIHPQVLDVSFELESESNLQNMASLSGVVIILNTQNFDKEMIVSRRSTYQRVLALEKEGAQVLERDSDLPVDIIISSAICLAWYDCSNIGKKTTTQDEASSDLPSYIENIAINVLTSLSFAFSSCILVFEGDASFLTTVMESSYGLYTAASTLGLKLQIFCSYSSDLTDDIILSSICFSAKFTRGLYPKMPESENLAESFLTKFPSVNPLTAHAILSSGGRLIDFLGWSHERRICAIQNYHVPEESVTLLSALCIYGEREDAKSILTDSSLSMSSGPDPDNSHHKVDYERKIQKLVRSPHDIDISVDDLMHFDPVNQFKPSQVSKQSASWMLKGPQIFDEVERPSLSLGDFSGRKQGSDAINSSKVPKTLNSQMLDGSQECWELDKAMMNSLGCCKANKSDNQIDDLVGEVIDLTGSPLSGEDFSSIVNSMNFSLPKSEIERDSTRKPKIVRRLSFGQDSHPTFPMAVDINFDSESLSYIEKQSSDRRSDGYADADLYRDKLPLKHHEKVFEEGIAPRSIINSMNFSLPESEIEKDSTRRPKIMRSLSFGQDSHPTFPMAADINFDSESWSYTEKQSSDRRSDGYADLCRDKLPLKHHEKVFEEGITQRSTGNFQGISFQEEALHYGGTPLSNAIHSSHLPQGSPWTIEFLNRIREKSRLRQQSLPCDTFSPCFDNTRSISKVTKRKNPSILDFYKYQGGRTTKKTVSSKRQKHDILSSSSSRKEKTSTSLFSTKTPVEKRARQTLSFASDVSGSQTKLVWSDGKAHALNRKLQNHV